MLCKVTCCIGNLLANTRPYQLRWGDLEMGNATCISCTECSQVVGLIQKVGRKKLFEGVVSSAPVCVLCMYPVHGIASSVVLANICKSIIGSFTNSSLIHEHVHAFRCVIIQI